MRGVTVNGDKLLASRLQMGLTQEELGRLARVDSKTIRKAEQGKRLDLTTLTRLAYALKTDLQQLIVPSDAETGQQVTWRDIFLQWSRAFDECNGELLMATYHDDAALYLPSGPNFPFAGVSRGKEAIRRAHESAWTLRQDPIGMDEITFIPSDQGLAFGGSKRYYKPSGDTFKCHVLHMLTFRDNLIFEHHVEFDTLDFMKQLGMLP